MLCDSVLRPLCLLGKKNDLYFEISNLMRSDVYAARDFLEPLSSSLYIGSGSKGSTSASTFGLSAGHPHQCQSHFVFGFYTASMRVAKCLIPCSRTLKVAVEGQEGMDYLILCPILAARTETVSPVWTRRRSVRLPTSCICRESRTTRSSPP